MNRTPLLVACLGIVGACTSGGDGDGGAAGEGRDTVKAVGQDLTNSLMIVGGGVQEGPIPEATAMDVDVAESGEVLTLVPGEASILPLGVDNPDEADNPVIATLMQFEGTDEHIHAEGTNKDGMVVQMYSVAKDACDDLCNKVYRLTMYEAVQLEDGSISERAVQNVELDCTKDGDPKKCSDGGSGGSGGGA